MKKVKIDLDSLRKLTQDLPTIFSDTKIPKGLSPSQVQHYLILVGLDRYMHSQGVEPNFYLNLWGGLGGE